MLLEFLIGLESSEIEAETRSGVTGFLHCKGYVEMLHLSSNVDDLAVICVIIGTVYLDPVLKITLNSRISIELHLIGTVLIDAESVIIDLVSVLFCADYGAVILELTLVIYDDNSFAAFEIYIPCRFLVRKISVIDHIKSHDRIRIQSSLGHFSRRLRCL